MLFAGRSSNRLLLLTLGAAILSGVSARAQDDPEIAELHRRSMKFLTDIARKDNVNSAFQELLKGGPLEKSDALQKLTPSVERFGDLYGALLDQERISYTRVGKDVVLLKYLYKTERYPIIWRFNFYRPPVGADSAWVVVGASFGTDLREFEQPNR